MKIFGVILGIVVFLAVTAFVVTNQPGSSGVIASLRLADGSDYMVTQDCNWSPEPYTISLYMRSKNGPWGWCYIDHQADRWSDVSLNYDPSSDLITITEQGAQMATLDRRQGTFSLTRMAPGQKVKAPQEYRDPSYPLP